MTVLSPAFIIVILTGALHNYSLYYARLFLLCLCHSAVSVKTFVFRLYICCVHPFVRLSGQILLPRYLIKGLRNHETYRELPLALADDLIRFWRSKVKATASYKAVVQRQPRRRCDVEIRLLLLQWTYASVWWWFRHMQMKSKLLTSFSLGSESMLVAVHIGHRHRGRAKKTWNRVTVMSHLAL